MLANLGATIGGVLTGVVAARALGPQGRGDLAVIVFWPSLIALLVDFGIADALTIRNSQNSEGAGAHRKTAYWLAVAASVLGVALGACAMPFLLRGSQKSLLQDGYFALAYVPLSALAAVPVGDLLGQQRFRAVAVIRLGTVVCYTVAMLASVLAGHGTVRVLTWLTVGARGLPLVLALPFAYSRRHDVGGPAFLPSHRRQVTDGLRLHGARLATVLGASEDRALANLMLTQRGIGLWQVASALTTVMLFVGQAVSQHLYSSSAGMSTGRAELIYKAYVRAVAITALIAILGSPLLPFVIPLLYGRDFSVAVKPAIVVMVASVFAAGAITLQAGARAMLKIRVCVISEIAGIIVMGLVAWPAVRAWSELGLGVAYLVGRLCVLAAMTFQAPRLFGIRSVNLIPGSARFIGTLGYKTPGVSG